MNLEFKNKPRDYSVIFLDMNSYFASVEQQVRPTLRGKPVGIAPYTGGTGCIIARSSEAKEWGVKTGDLVREAKNKCPKITVVEARPVLYQFYHREIVSMLKKTYPFIDPLSIDEFLVRLTGSDINKFRALKVAEDIKRGIREIGDWLTCSIGIAPNYFLAKVAGESKKPDGLTVLEIKNLDSFFKQIKLRDIPGINFRMENQLARKGVYTAHDFYQKSLPEQMKMLGHMGKGWYFRLRGYEIDNFEIRTKTCGHSHVLSPELRTWEGAMATVEKLVQKTGYRLRKDGFWAKGVAVYIGSFRGGGCKKAKRCQIFNDNKSLLNNVNLLLKDCRLENPSYVAVNAFDLVRTKNVQISILPEIERSRSISKALDEINDEFGAGTVYTLGQDQAKNAAPDRIPFGRPRYNIINF